LIVLRSVRQAHPLVRVAARGLVAERESAVSGTGAIRVWVGPRLHGDAYARGKACSHVAPRFLLLARATSR